MHLNYQLVRISKRTAFLFRLKLIFLISLFCTFSNGQNSVATSSHKGIASKTNVVATFSGTGRQVLRPFASAAPWEIRWKANDDFFLDINTNGKLDRVVTHIGKSGSEAAGIPLEPGSGIVKQSQSGKFNLEILGPATWHIEIISDAKVPLQKEIHKPHIITTFSGSKTEPLGNGEYHTPIFSTNGPWEVQWLTQGNIFSIFLHNADGTENPEAGAAGSKQGTSYCSKAGKYYYVVLASSTWHITILTSE